MIDEVIREYISGNKRLVIPELGALIRKDSGEAVLVEFLRKDDGVLSGLLETRGMDAVGALRAIESFVKTVREEVARTNAYTITGLGTIYKTVDGLYELDYDPAAVKKSPAAAETAGRQEPAESKETVTAIAEETSAGSEEEPATESGSNFAGEIKASAPETYGVNPDESAAGYSGKKSGKLPASGSEKPFPEKQEPRQIYTDREIVKDLRYQKPAKAQTYYSKKRRADLIIIIAILAAVAAIGAIVYGVAVNKDPMSQMQHTNPVENTTDAAPATPMAPER